MMQSDNEQYQELVEQLKASNAQAQKQAQDLQFSVTTLEVEKDRLTQEKGQSEVRSLISTLIITWLDVSYGGFDTDCSKY